MRTLLPALLLLVTAAAAQSITPKTIQFSGAPQYPPAELLKLSGLTPGHALSQADIEAAMHHLDDSGLFAGITFSAANGVLTFVLEPLAKSATQHAAYTNFAWYTQPELTALVHAKLPLFTGDVPADGNLAPQVERALEAILKERGIEAQVHSQSVAGNRLDFSIINPPVLVGELKIDNIHFDSNPTLTDVRKALVGVEYIESVTPRSVHDNLAYALEELGYLDQTVSPIGHQPPRVERSSILVDMTGTAQPGQPYKVARVDLPAIAGTMSPKNFDSEHRITPGGLPAPSVEKNTIFGFTEAYRSHGFLDVALTVDRTVDHAAHTVSYTYRAVPGDPYRMRTLSFAGSLTAPQQAQLTQAWQIPKGAIYDSSLAERSRQDPSVGRICSGRPATLKPTQDQSTHQVDVTLSCTPRPAS